MDIAVQILKAMPKSLAQKFVKVYLRNGKKGYVKLLVAVLIIWNALYAYLKQKGLLPKKSVVGKHILITGAGSGIGKGMAIKFAGLGAKVSILDINFEGAQQVENQLKSEGANVIALKCDVSSLDSVNEAIANAIDALGPVDILINNAGVVSGRKLLQNSENSIKKTLEINTLAHAYTVRAVLPEMLSKNEGHIVTIASVAGLVGVSGLADYCASKYGAVGFDESLRNELRQLKSNVKTTCICPYYINTGMFDGVVSKFEFLMPIMTEIYATNRIVNAILQEEPVTVMPWILNLVLLARALFPVCMFDYLCDVLGANQSMDHFQGKRRV